MRNWKRRRDRFSGGSLLLLRDASPSEVGIWIGASTPRARGKSGEPALILVAVVTELEVAAAVPIKSHIFDFTLIELDYHIPKNPKLRTCGSEATDLLRLFPR